MRPEARVGGWGDAHRPSSTGGCFRLVECACELVAGAHCSSCGRGIVTRPGLGAGVSWTTHVGPSVGSKLAALEARRRRAAGR